MNTKNWTQLATDVSSDEMKKIYHKYDELVSITITNLANLATPEGKIKLLSFDRKNIEHIYMLRIALWARDLFGIPVEIDASWRDVLYINWKIRKNFRKIKGMAWGDCLGIPTDIVLNYMRESAKENLGVNFNFGDIYYAYYEGSIV